MNRLLKTFGIVLVLSFLAGCGAASTPTMEPGWELYERPTYGFAIALPATWEPWSDEITNTAVQVAQEQNPQAAAAWEKQLRDFIGSDLAPFVGLDLAPESVQDDLATAVVVVKHPTDRSLDAYVKVYTDWLNSSEAAIPPVTHVRISLPAGVAEKVQFRRTITNVYGRAGTVAMTQYLIIRENDIYMIALSTTAGQADKYAPIFEKIAKSLRWIK